MVEMSELKVFLLQRVRGRHDAMIGHVRSLLNAELGDKDSLLIELKDGFKQIIHDELQAREIGRQSQFRTEDAEGDKDAEVMMTIAIDESRKKVYNPPLFDAIVGGIVHSTVLVRNA